MIMFVIKSIASFLYLLVTRLTIEEKENLIFIDNEVRTFMTIILIMMIVASPIIMASLTGACPSIGQLARKLVADLFELTVDQDQQSLQIRLEHKRRRHYKLDPDSLHSQNCP